MNIPARFHKGGEWPRLPDPDWNVSPAVWLCIVVGGFIGWFIGALLIGGAAWVVLMLLAAGGLI
jgi:hypothetical protein